MMARAMAAAERRGAVVVAERAERLAVAVRVVAPGVSVVRDGGEVTIAGRGVLDDPALRWPGGLLR